MMRQSLTIWIISSVQYILMIHLLGSSMVLLQEIVVVLVYALN
jgi:hypothetical protein